MTVTQEIMFLYEAWKNIDKETLNVKIEEEIIRKYPEVGRSTSDKISILCELLSANPHTVHAWFNKGRPIKIPFIKLCEVLNKLNVDILEVFKEEL